MFHPSQGGDQDVSYRACAQEKHEDYKGMCRLQKANEVTILNPFALPFTDLLISDVVNHEMYTFKFQ